MEIQALCSTCLHISTSSSTKGKRYICLTDTDSVTWECSAHPFPLRWRTTICSDVCMMYFSDVQLWNLSHVFHMNRKSDSPFYCDHCRAMGFLQSLNKVRNWPLNQNLSLIVELSGHWPKFYVMLFSWERGTHFWGIHVGSQTHASPPP